VGDTQEGESVENVEFLDRLKLRSEDRKVEEFGSDDKFELVTGEGRNDRDHCIGETVFL
jgi:hypothetical protein